MLYITRKIGEEIVINNDIFVVVKEVSRNKVKLGFKFPEKSTILRKEIYDRILDENLSAKESLKQSLPELKPMDIKFRDNNSE